MRRIVLGIDLSKKTLDTCLLFDNRIFSKQFKNSSEGFERLAAWLVSLHIGKVHACLEATGIYGEAVALFLHDQGHLVSVVNPLRIKGYAGANMQRNKTDYLDARLIADFCLTQKPDSWQPPSETVKHLQSMMRRIETLEEMRQAEENRLVNVAFEIKPSIERIIRILEDEIGELERQIKQHINKHPDLKEQSELLQTIPGIGARTANLLLSEIEFARYSSARSIAAQAGVRPRKRQSGTSLKQTSLSKLGNARLRRALYFPAITAKQHNKIIKEFAERLKKNGKTPMQIVCAAMRKLLHIAFGVLKHKRAFDANLAFSA
ncbi:MAG: IS110 family transposase [Acidobacteriota bacterium]|nr:IS110 family transposase [Acidobacteriota bacterium]